MSEPVNTIFYFARKISTKRISRDVKILTIWFGAKQSHKDSVSMTKLIYTLMSIKLTVLYRRCVYQN